MDLNLFTSENPSQQFKNWLFSNDCISLGLIGDFYPKLFNRLALLNKILLARFNINCYIKTKLDEEHLTDFPKNLLTASKYSSSLFLFDNCQKVLKNSCRMSWLVSLALFRHEANIHRLFNFHNLNKEPFLTTEQIYSYATDYLDRIDELSPETIYFIRSQNEEGTSGIILKLSKFKFTYFPKTWNISDRVDSTRSHQIFEFYRLIEALKTQHNLVNPPYYFQGRSVNPEDFTNLFCGKIYPGARVNLDENPWWDDFTDFAHPYFNLRTNMAKSQEIL